MKIENEIDEILETNKIQSKAFNTILEELTKTESESIDEDSDNPNYTNTNKKISLMSKITSFIKKWFFVVAVFLLSSSAYAQSNHGFVSKKVRVKLTPTVQVDVEKNIKIQLNSLGDDIVRTGNSQLDALNERYHAVKMTRVFPDAGKNEYKHIKHGLNLWYEIEVDQDVDLSYVANMYSSSAAVITAEPIGAKTLGDYKIIPAGVASTEDNLPMNDPYLSDQWHYHNDGSMNYSVAGSDIDLFPAWDIEKGKSDVVVAIVDGGIDINHEDLAEHVWVNEVEKNGEPGVDDDNNGFIDDINGFNFTTYRGEITGHDHGTHVAGTVGAINNNGTGVSGVAGGSGNGDGVRLMSCQIFNNNNESGNFAAAVVYGADNGAVISQNSWSYVRDGLFEQALLDAIDYFVAEAGNFPGSKMKGGVVIFAAGNDNLDAESYPAYYPSTIAVASIGSNMKRAGYSNYGDWVDVSATGGNLALGSKHGVLSTTVGSNYSYMQGTSMACPHVSGIAALVVSHYGSDHFTNEELKSRILTGANNIDSYNPDYIGKLGTGLIDAKKTLEFNSSEVPEAITDLNVDGVSQDFALLSWSVPNDSDDVTPLSYIVYWSENEITVDNISDANSTVVVNGDKLVGDKFTFEVSSLNSLTKYYFNVVAVDRWGNKSPMSNSVSANTNEGPEISTDKNSIAVDIDGTGNFTTSDVLNIVNNKEGVLRWEASTRDVSNKASVTAINFPSAPKLKMDNLANVSMDKLDNANEVVAAPASSDWKTSTKRYFDVISPSYVIGDTDSTVANSMAIRFYVDEEEGFNLTRVAANMRLDKEDGPAIVEIYKGNEIAKENLIYTYTSDKYEDGLVAYKNNETKVFTHDLKEQLFFEKGETFWIVYHVPAGNYFPLGIYPEARPEYSGHCLFSTDKGATWQTLEAASGDANYVWAISAKSLVQKLDTYITLTPESGEITGIGENNIDLSVDATKLINGVYKSNVIIRSNDMNSPFYRVPVTLNVNGHKPKLNSQSIVSFGNVFYGLTKTLDVELQNTGYGRFITSSIVSSNPDVFIVGKSYMNLPAREEDKITITYKPNGAGNSNAVITLTSTKGEKYEFSVFGVGSSPAQIKVTPDVLTFDNIDLNETTALSKNITITNTGEYPLQYGFTNFADDLSHIDWVGNANVPRYGYSMGLLDYPQDYVFNDISDTGIDVTHFYKNDGPRKFVEIDLGFDFPYFGEKVNKLYITKYGMLTLDDKSKFNATIFYHDIYAPDGYICPYASLFSLGTQGSVTYKKALGKVIVQYKDVRSVSGVPGQSFTYQIELYDNGDIKFIYDKIEGLPDYKGMYIAIENREKNDGIPINGRGQVLEGFGPKKILFIKSPGHDLVKNVAPAKGVILPGQSQELTLSINREKLVEGSHRELVAVLSNDPFNRGRLINVQLNVVSGGATDVQLEKTSVDVGDVFKNQKVNGVFEIYNKGNKSVFINSIVSESGFVEYLGKSNLELKPQQTMYVEYKIKTDALANISDNLVISDNEGETYKVRFTGNVIEASSIVVSTDGFSESLNYNEVKSQPLTLENNGVADLDYAIVGTSLVYPRDNASAKKSNEVADFEYVYKTTFDENPAQYGWYTVGGENKLPFLTDDYLDFWYKIDLPFEFTFYNKTYSSMWIGMQGAVTFDEPVKKNTLLTYAERMGVDDNINNMIAPFYQPCIYEDQADVTKSGVFVKEDSEKFIVEWREFFSAMGGSIPFDRQLVIYKDGRIKFQYHSNFDYLSLRAIDGVVGIENGDASEFTQVSYYQKFAGKDVAVEFYPAVKETLKAGESKTFDIMFDATDWYAGTFNQDITISTNDPLNEQVAIPAHVVINGEPTIELSNDIAFGDVMLTPRPKAYTKEFYIKNTGTKRASLKRFSLQNNDEAVLQAFAVDRQGRKVWVELSSPLVADRYNIEPNTKVGPFRILLIPTDDSYFGGTYTNKLKMRTDFGTSRLDFPITANYIKPPKATINKTDISHVAYDDTVINDDIKIGNILGNSVLNYQISLDYNRTTIAPSLIEPNLVAGEMNIVKHSISGLANTQAVNQGDYNRILSHDKEEFPNNAIGIGGESPFTLATAFVAPADGFKLSNVQTWYIPESLASSEIKVEIRVGSEIETSSVQYSETFNYTSTETNMKGLLLDFQLSEPVSLMPYEKFYVVFTYPVGVSGPQGIVAAPNNPNTFLMYYINKWYDIQELNTFEDVGLMVRAAEKEAENLNWLEISDIEGTVEKGTEKDIKITLHPERSRRDINKVVMTFNTNDPFNKKLEAVVSLRKNQGPEIVVSDDYTVNEADTLDVSFDVVDVEGDGIKSVTMKKYENTTFSYADGRVHFTYIPTHSDAGMKTFEVETEDNLGVKSTRSFKVDVINVNIAPIVINDAHIIIDTEHPQYRANFTDIFYDPDNGEMIYTVKIIGDKTVAKVFMADNEFIVNPLKTGFSKVELTALDADGDKTVTVKNIVVNAMLSNEELLAGKWGIYPNVVSNEMQIHLNGITDKSLEVRVINQSGSLVMSFDADVENNMIIESVDGLSSGVYMVQLLSKEGKSVHKMIKK